MILRNVGHGVNDIFWYILPSLLPVILDQFGMKYGTAGGLLTAFLGVVAVFSFILGIDWYQFLDWYHYLWYHLWYQN